jgi:hypothetical protein
MAVIKATLATPGGGTIKASVTTVGQQLVSVSPLSLVTKPRLDQLFDVVEQELVDGATLVYDANSDKYVLKTPNVNGGSF